jgi:hypothetical protein
LSIGDIITSVFFFVRLFFGCFGRELGQTHPAAKLGFERGLVRLGNVYGCEGLAYPFSSFL